LHPPGGNGERQWIEIVKLSFETPWVVWTTTGCPVGPG
jgi:hypothetical protein